MIYKYLMIVEYDGLNYYGIQRQSQLPSIQKELEKALKNMTSQKILVLVAGRTDKGVHAKGQVVHFETRIKLDGEVWKIGLNKRLPEDIRIKEVRPVKIDFHARHSAKAKRYDYVISKKPVTAFNSRYQVYVENLDTNLMKEALKDFIGTHDFKGFSIKISGKPTEKTILKASLKETKDKIILSFTGDSFLRYMVRRMTGLLIEIGKQKEPISRVREILNNPDLGYPVKAAPANGLYLVKIFY